MKPFIEKEFTYRDFKCAILMMDLGHRCGYVDVSHTKFNNINYMDIETLFDVHGGLTYSSKHLYGFEDGWWIGFDCAHYMDAPDYASLCMLIGKQGNKEDMERVLNSYKFSLPFYKDDIIRTQEYVEEELIHLVDQIIDKM